MRPKVSVIIATFNAAIHIRKAIESFLIQTFDSRELIIIDGGSSDDTVSIVKEYQDVNIRWISEPDNGVYDAMNKGVVMATGEWLYFLGADDFFVDKSALEKVFVNDLAKTDIVYGDVYSVLLKRNYDGPTSKEKLLFSNLCHQSIFYRKEVFEKAGNYNLAFKLFADWEFNIRCFIQCKFHTQYVPVVIAEYAASGISTLNKDMNFLRNFLFPVNLKYLHEVGEGRLENIKFYDRWWRLLRSMKVEDDLKGLSNGMPVPKKIIRMQRFQKSIPEKILFVGIFSKSLMLVSYLFNR